MQVTLEQLEPCKVAVHVEVGPEAVQDALDRVFRQIAKQVAVPGFRKGRAPRHILERYIDAELVRERAVRELVPEYFSRAVSEHGIEPVALPDVEAGTLEAGTPFRFTATVPTRPQVRLCDYRNVPARRRRVEVSDKDVDAEIELMRARHTRMEDADATEAGGDLWAVVDLDAYRGNRRLVNRSRADVPINMADTQSVPAFNLAIEGARIGETREMPVHYPEDYPDPVLAGKDITYKITVKALKRAVLPEVTDEFAQTAANVENVEALRAKVREDLEKAASEVADREVREQVVEYVVAHSDVHFPDVMVQEQVARAIQDRVADLQKRGLTLDDYLQARKMDLADYEREVREEVRRQIRTELVLEEIAREEQIEATEEDVDRELERLAYSGGMAPAVLRSALERQGGQAMRNLRAYVRRQKAIDLLASSARITEG